MFTDLNDYIRKPIAERRLHLKLDDECIEIGGDSRLFRGLLGHFLRTTISCRLAFLCHACNNSKCSNVNHLYWGTPKENVQDSKDAGTWTSWYQKCVTKYGSDFNKIKKRPKSHTRPNAQLDPELIKSRTNDFLSEDKSWGIIQRLATKWDISHTQVRRFLKSHGLVPEPSSKR